MIRERGKWTPGSLPGCPKLRHLRMSTLSTIASFVLFLLYIHAIIASASYSRLQIDALLERYKFSAAVDLPSTPASYVVILRKVRNASINPQISKHTIKCMLYKGLWQCISEDETALDPGSMHPIIWEYLGEAIEMSAREVAQGVSGRFESQAVQERVAEQTINEMIMLFIPASKVMHAREIFAGNSRKMSLSAPSYNVMAKGKELLTWHDGSMLTSDYDAFLMTRLAVDAWKVRSNNCASRGFIVQFTDEYETVVRPFDRHRLLSILRRFMDKKYRTITSKQQ